MSGSPRKLLRRAADAMRQAEELWTRYPDARADLEGRLGPDRFQALVAARETLEDAVARLGPGDGPGEPPGDAPGAGAAAPV